MEKYEVSENSFKYGLINFHEMRPLAENTMKYLIAEANNFKEHYIKLGRHLYEFKNNEYYKDFGFDNFEEGQFFSPSLTSVNRNWEQLGYEGIEKLLELIHGGVEPGEFKAVGKLALNESCCCAFDKIDVRDDLRNV